ncbi:gliding motility-associated ABC transporter permease subunit GldF [Robiginitalea sp. SC105]|uniref:gliding motility-associated ABC transporter permease subunit GldF n=1 Tax=Robiginitalea sp. SC105 TaxID=2762332 RepID=UPI001639A6CD|nr:gliding motility-associated ABC transporter permease subunit GldF [Robiginitalea sp. SC105]MBC2840358.1 gliding motility-associated ABC transporter permease subunit GldF [Robiginitalea sp. SC105]
MFAIFRKEFSSFFSSPVGYLVAGIFLVLTGLFLWVFRGPYNIIDYGFADLSLFFLLVPWVFLLLIPAVCMKTFAEERKLGTLELLLSKPIPLNQLVLGKFLGVCALIGATLLPTLLYVWAIHDLGATAGNLDSGLVWGSYIGLALLMCVYAAVSLFASSLTDNQIVAFMLSVVACFLLYQGPESLATLILDGDMALFVRELGARAHYETIGQGILDSRDLIYFIGLTAFFLFLAASRLKLYRQ